ncbi:MAG: PQQ-binding-like beta-propeller repeat protein, partial [Planctomycetaceae bacterium]|nr:PQQ-binding-like beta-propeller repeat protein [Planctomycetaceae bacterium]
DWEAKPPRELWRQPCGGGYGQMSIVGDLLLSIEQRGANEAVVCYDATTGNERWVHEYPARFEEAMGGPGPRSTPTIDGDAVFTVGALGDVYCLDLLSGNPRWHLNLLKEYKLANNQWAMTSSPLVLGSKVILNPGGEHGYGLIAVHRDTGAMIWEAAGVATRPETPPQENRPGYSCPVLVSFLGLDQLLHFDGTGLRSYDPATGEQYWYYPFENDAAVNVAQPILFDDGRILVSASYDKGAAMIQVSHEAGAWKVTELWHNLNLRCKFTSPLYIDGYLYGLDEGLMVCLDAATGERRWKGSRSGLRGRYKHGQLLLTNGQIVALTEDGELVLVDPSPDELREVTHVSVLSSGTKTWNPPTLSRGIAYVRNAEEMVAVDLRAGE